MDSNRSGKLSGLALRAEVRGPAAEDDAADGGFAAGAGLTFAGINAVQKLKPAPFAVGIDVVALRAERTVVLIDQIWLAKSRSELPR